MKRCLSNGFIVAYLSVLLFGVVTHALQYHAHRHPLTYYIVWDMFCGWSAWEQRTHIVGEGESGTLYELAPGPWGEYHPYGDIPRQHYDPFFNHAVRQGINVLKHTRHEPISRILVYEEVWPKKCNLPEPLRQRLCPVPQDPASQFQLRWVCDGEGTVQQRYVSWFDIQAQQAVSNNPRLQREVTPSKQQVILASGMQGQNSAAELRSAN
ncbi:hypothetical protein GC176_04825 [bacterium]|nr:hypothetical protein [bacterium]